MPLIGWLPDPEALGLCAGLKEPIPAIGRQIAWSCAIAAVGVTQHQSDGGRAAITVLGAAADGAGVWLAGGDHCCPARFDFGVLMPSGLVVTRHLQA